MSIIPALKPRYRRFGVLACVAVATLLGTSTAANALYEPIIVDAQIENDLQIEIAGCPSESAGTTAFGTVAPGVPQVTSADCAVEYGSTATSSMLKVYQRDRGGSALTARPNSAENAYWPLNGMGENVGKNATATHQMLGFGTPADPAYVAGPSGLGQALQFDGNDRAASPHQDSNFAGALTFDMWFRTSDISNAPYPTIFHGGSSASATGFAIQFDRDNDMLIAGTLKQFPLIRSQVSAPAAGLDDGNWHHVALTLTSTSPRQQLLYVDGVQVGAANGLAGDGTYQTSETTIGDGIIDVFADPFIGDIDEVRIHTVVRTPTEIRSYVTGQFDDYNSVTNTWAMGNNLFGACVRSVSGAGVTAGNWTVDGNNDCTATDTDPWKSIAAGPGDAASKISANATAGLVTARVALRFGLRADVTLPPGNYEAPIVFEVFSPNV